MKKKENIKREKSIYLDTVNSNDIISLFTIIRTWKTTRKIVRKQLEHFPVHQNQGIISQQLLQETLKKICESFAEHEVTSTQARQTHGVQKPKSNILKYPHCGFSNLLSAFFENDSSCLARVEVWVTPVSQFLPFCWVFRCFGCHIIPLIIRIFKLLILHISNITDENAELMRLGPHPLPPK